jgi:hypothetical protein
MSRSLETLRDEAASALRDYSHSDESGRTDCLRKVAALLVEAREHFYTADGTVDWRGRTYAYRQLVGEAFAGADLPADDVSSVQAAVRYHVSAVLRTRLDAQTLESLGLVKASARARSTAKRSRQSAILSIASGGAAFEDAESIERALAAVTGILGRIPSSAVKGLTAAERRQVHDVAERIASDARYIEQTTSSAAK